MDKSSGWIQPVYESFVSTNTARQSRAKRSRKMTSYPRGSVNSSIRSSDQEMEDERTTDEEEDAAPMSRRTDEPSSSRTPPSNTTSEEKKTKPTCTIRLVGGRYRKDIELTMDSEVDNLVYRVLKCLDEECVEIGGLQVKGKKNPMLLLHQFLAPFASCFSYKPRCRPKRRCLCHRSKPRRSSGMRKTTCAHSDESNKREKIGRRKRKRTPCSRLLKKCRRTVLCSRSCCRKDDVVLIEICPSQTTDTSVKYKKQKERGVGTDASPELEILLNGRSLRCVAKKTGLKCRCTQCCPKSRKKAHRAPTKEERVTEESDEDMRDSWKTRYSGEYEDSPRRKTSKGNDGKGKWSSERSYSLMVNSNYNPTWESEYESTSGLLSNDFDEPRATPCQKPVRWRVTRSPLLYNARSEPFNVYSPQKQNYIKVVNMENWKYNSKKPFVPRLQEIRGHINDKNTLCPITNSQKKKISSKLFFGSDYILELHETSEGVEETLRDQNTKRQTVCISDYLRLHKLFQRSHLSKMNLTSSNSKTSSLPSEDTTRKLNRQSEHETRGVTVLKLTSPHFNETSTSASNDKGKKPSKQQESETHKVTVLRNEYFSQKVFTKVSNLYSCTASNENLSATSLPKEGLLLKTSTLFLKKFPPTKKSTNLLAFLKNIRSERKLSKDEAQSKELKPINSFSRKFARNFQKLKMYLKLSQKSKTNSFSPVTLGKKQGMLNLSFLVSDS